MSPPSLARVVIVDDHGLFRSGVRTELGDLVEVVGEAATVEEAVDCILPSWRRRWSCSTFTCPTAGAWR